MIGRLDRARRILSVQSALDRLAALKMQELERQAAALSERRRALARFLDVESDLAGRFIMTATRRIEQIDKQQADLSVERDKQAASRFEERRRCRSAQRVVEGLERDTRRAEEAALLSEAVEGAIQRRS